MSRNQLAMAVACVATALTATAQAQQPPTATTKVEGTDNVYIFRYMGHQSMFIVTPDGVIATDPIGERRPAAAAYIAEIRKITQAPIKYVVYSHSHYDHIAGGKPFKDMGATFVAQTNAKARLAALKPDDIVLNPCLVVLPDHHLPGPGRRGRGARLGRRARLGLTVLRHYWRLPARSTRSRTSRAWRRLTGSERPETLTLWLLPETENSVILPADTR